MSRAEDNLLTRLELFIGDFARACVAAAIIIGGSFLAGSFLAGVLKVLIERGGL